MATKTEDRLRDLPLDTVEDALTFFGKVEELRAEGVALPPNNPLFFARVDSGLVFDPYNIRTVPRDNCPSNYYVVTADHIIKVNRKESKFVRISSLPEWTQEAAIFSKLRGLHFFANFVKLKALLRLVRRSRETKFARSRAALSKQLLTGFPFYSDNIMGIRRHAFDMEFARTNPTAALEPIQTLLVQGDGENNSNDQVGYSTEQFLSAQGLHLRHLKKYLAEALLSILETVTQCALDAENGVVMPTRVADSTKNVIGSVNKEVVAKQQHEQKKIVKKHWVTYEYVNLLLRLAHHMQLEAIFGQAARGFFAVQCRLDGKPASSAWMFRIDCVVANGGNALSLIPPKDHVLEVVQKVLADAISTISNIPTCLSSEQLLLNRPLINAGSVREAILGDELVKRYMDAIAQRLSVDYTEAERKINSFGVLVTVAQFLRGWEDTLCRWESALSRPDSVIGAIEESELRKNMSTATKLRTELKKIERRAFGTIMVTCESAVKGFEAKLDNAIGDCGRVLSELAESQFVTLKKECSAWSKKLQPPELQISEYVAWYVGLQDAEHVLETFLQNVSSLRGLYLLQQEMSEKLGDAADDETPADLNADLRDPFSTAVDEAKTYHLSTIGNMRTKINAEHGRTIASLQEIQQNLSHSFGDRKINSGGSSAAEKLEKIQETINRRRKDARELDDYVQILKMPLLNWIEIGITDEELKKYVELWRLHAELNQLKEQLDTTPVSKMDGQELKDKIVALFQRAFKAQKTTPGDAADELVSDLSAEKSNLGIYMELCNPALKEEHWKKIFSDTGLHSLEAPQRTLRALGAVGLFGEDAGDSIRAVVSEAVGIYELEQNLSKLDKYWAERCFSVVPYAGRANAFVIDAADEIKEELEEQQMVVQTCLASKYLGPLQSQVESWDTRLNEIHAVIDEWVNVQKSWMYLEFIFSSDDIKRQLPDESLLFSSADRFFTTHMKRCSEDSRVLPLCTEGGDVLKKFQKCAYQLDCIQKKIDEYLETKRVAFPRFYFLSNDELLSILSDSRNPSAVQPHLQKCFDNIKELVFTDPKTIAAMKSGEGEVVEFSREIKVMGNVESWLNDVERAMRETLYDRMAICVAAYSVENRRSWFFEHPAQCVATVDQIVWTGEVELVINEMGVDSNAWNLFQERYIKQLLETVELVKTPLSSLQRTVVTNLIVADVHCRDAGAQLAAAGCSSLLDFDWQKQLRFYYCDVKGEAAPGAASKQDCIIRHGAAELSYGYEYLGNQARLVITPLTERAFMTCTAALHMQKGAAPQGPAGTGKTESVKDLGKALARQVVVFNCSDGLDYRMMSQMFAGLAQGGAWACFDEFNRIELEVLSVVAQQMLDITTAIAQKQTSMSFEGHRIKLHENFGVFITMNPGYAGRTELPDNLKSLFRPICMMIPNYALIAEIMFYSEGYTKARVLADKMIRLYSLASQQLSKQDHYDFGMRAVKSILVLAGRLKRSDSDAAEDLLLVRAIREANLPKFLWDDGQLFLALLRDFFPTLSEVGTSTVGEVIEREGARVLEKEMKLEATSGMVHKIQQLFDTLTTRHGLMLVGHTMTGKTAIRTALAKALTALGAQCRAAAGEPDSALLRIDDRYRSYFVPTTAVECNPKSISMTELYGDVNPLTREWQDGVFSAIVREMVRAANQQGKQGNERHWVVFDGPVDAVWIENLNTVLDDSKMLCLVNGERIRIPDCISLLFEVQDLRVASPATVSRCGMVYVDQAALGDGWTPILSTLSKGAARRYGERWQHERFMSLCTSLITPLLKAVRRDCKEYIATSNAQLALNVFYLLEAGVMELVKLIEQNNLEREQSPAGGGDSSSTRASSVTAAVAAAKRASRRRSSIAARASVALLGQNVFDALFVQSCAWGLGGNLTEASRATFADAMLPLVREECLYFPEEAEGDSRTVYDYCLDLTVGNWRPWSELVPAFTYNPALSYFDLIVPTSDTVVLQYLLRCAVATKHHLLINGLTGTGKSATVHGFLLGELRAEEASSPYTAFAYTLSAQTSSATLQNTIESKLARRKGDREFGAPAGKQLVIAVIDDCNVPQLEEYGAAPPVELLRQMITQGGFYDRKKLFFKEVVQTMVVACCGEPGGGKNEMTPRFTSKMLTFCARQLSDASMRSIFTSILDGFFAARSFAEEVCALSEAVVDSTIEAYRRIAVECLPTPAKTHCTFNLRDVSKVIQGVLQVKPAQCTTAQDLVLLWSHEASRVFHDRLVDDTDRAWWWRCCGEVAAVQFAHAGVDAAALREDSLSTIMYGTWATHSGAEYQRITQSPHTIEVVRGHLAGYNLQSTSPMNLVFFTQAVEHLSRLCRVISQPRGHALLVGVGGSGRSSLCRLAACMMNMEVQHVHLVRNYGIEDFREEMRKALLDAGARGKDVVFLLSDPELVCGEMLEDVNNILNSGEVPGMMRMEDLEVVLRLCREPCLSAGRPDTRTSIYEFFVGQCRERLHLCLCMSPMSGQFRDRLRMFPALVNCTTIDWYSEWPQEALMAVAESVLGDGSDAAPAEAKTAGPSHVALGELMVHIHSTVKTAATRLFAERRRRTHVTPTSYLSALSLYSKMQEELLKENAFHAQRYRSGLGKLDNAKEMIGQLQKQIREMQPALAAAAVEVDQQRRTVAAEQQEADTLKVAQSVEEAAAQVLMKEAEAIRAECEEGLQKALPSLEAAERALQTLSAKDIQEIKTFTTPPGNVEKTLNAVLVLLSEKEGWASAKLCLNKMDFISRLTEYPRDTISAATIRKLVVFVEDPDFIPEVIEKTSLACKSMCMWVHAMYKYYFVAKEIAPKRARLQEAEIKVAAAREELDHKQKALKAVLDRIAKLEETAAAAQQRADDLNAQMEAAKARLHRADQLISGLAAERERWEDALRALDARRPRVWGTAALGAGSISYLGPFPLDYREDLLKQWKARCEELRISYDADFAVERMQSDATVQQWSLQSLPRDVYSVQNATILHRSPRCCYMIDPQGQANTFLRRLQSSKPAGAAGLLLLKPSSPNFMRQIESAVQMGQTVLLEDAGETLDTALDPILLKQVRRVAGRDVIVLGDKEVAYDDRFSLCVTTKLPNPSLTPELQVKLTVIDFTVTREGLEEQLLGDVVGSERAALQQSSDRCVVSIAASRQEIRALEEQVLRLLNEATGDILDNVELIEALQTSKTTAERIAKELVTMEATNATITATREMYRPLAARGSLIYGVIADVAKVNPMYANSLPFFKKVIASVLRSTRKGSASLEALEESRSSEGAVDDDAAPTEEEVAARVSMLVEETTWTSYRVICRGLFESHKLLFSFMLTTTLMKSTSAISDDEWSLFLRGGAGRALPPAFSEALEGEGGAPLWPSYMTKGMWVDFGAVCALTAFADVERDFFAAMNGSWKHWFTSVWGDAVLTEMPAPLLQLSLWHRLMAVKVLQPGKLHSVARQLVATELGERYTRTPGFSLAEAFADSDKTTPVIFVLSPGTDPTVLFTSFAAECGFGDRKYMLSLGQDQGTRAEGMMKDGQRDGSWVYLQNCHVYASWMPRLQQLVESMVANDVHEDYRLWLTSSPSPAFPVAVLQAGLKLTREPPMGLKGKVLDTLSSGSVMDLFGGGGDDRAGASGADQDLGDSSTRVGVPAATPRVQQLVFTLAFFHGLVMERRRFHPLGWNITYDWGASDFAAGLCTIDTALSRYTEEEPIPWLELSYMLGTIDYGGRVTDEWDTRCLQVIARSFFSETGHAACRRRSTTSVVGGLVAPALPEDGCTYDELLRLVEQVLPEDASPMQFGLHENTTTAVQLRQSNEMVSALVNINAGGEAAPSSSGEDAAEDPVSLIAQQLLDRVPPPLPRVDAVATTATPKDSTADPAPLQTLLSHEVDLYNRLLACIRSSLRELLAALRGTVVMTAQTEQMRRRVAFNQVPDMWARVGYLSLKPLGAYYEDLLRRVDFVRLWASRGPPASFWLPGLFFPQGFVTAVLQARSRALQVPIDSLQYRYRVLAPAEAAAAVARESPDSQLVGAYIHGLYLEGCGWDTERGGLVEASPGALTVELPVLHMEPVEVAEAEQANHGDCVYECPLYKVRTRAGTLSTTGVSTNYVVNVFLPSLDGISGDHWVLRGVAALCALDT